MGLEDVKAQLQEQLKEAQEREEKEPILDEGDEVIEDPKTEEPEKEPEKVEEKPAEEVKEPEKPAEISEEDKRKEENRNAARLRREAAEEKRRADELEAENRKLKEKPVEDQESEVILPPKVEEMLNDHMIVKAEREFEAFENEVKAQNPDYAAVAGGYAQAMFASLRLQNPDASAPELQQMTKNALLNRAGSLMKRGYKNPAEEMYLQAKEMGFGQQPVSVEKPKEEPKPDMSKVAANRARNAGTAAASGQNGEALTRAGAATMTNAQWMALSRDQKEKYLRAR